jgi:hypothetical protein
VLGACSAAITTEVEDIDGGPPGGCWRQVRQRPPLKLKTSMVGPREVSELEIRERPPPTLRNVDGGPQEVPELEIRERSACGARPSGRAMNGCRNLGTNAQRVVRTYFTLTQVGHFW